MQTDERYPPVHRPRVIIDVIRQHADEVASLHDARTFLTKAPYANLYSLQRFDDRIDAHLEGLSLAGDAGWAICESSLDEPSTGAMFTTTVRAIEERRQDRLDRLIALAEAVPGIRTGLLSAFGWVERQRLQGLVARLLVADDDVRRATGIAVCAVHRVDPSLAESRLVDDASARVRARALRAAGELGLHRLVSKCASIAAQDVGECQFWASWSAVLLGDRQSGVESLAGAALAPHPHRTRALRLVLQAMSVSEGRHVLRQLADDETQWRLVIEGSGIAGDPTYVPWLVGRMAKDLSARLAGEAFSLITGADLEDLGLDRQTPQEVETGPNDDADDPNVAPDPDDGLPWPHPEKVQAWWAANASRFQQGRRYFMGAQVTRAHCLDVLTKGYQRQRILAAQYLCLLQPGTPLFNTSSPARDQRKKLRQGI